MGRNVGRIGGASAGIIAVLFGVLELLDKAPPPWVSIGLGIVAVLGVLADYFVEQRRDGGSSAPDVKQRLRAGKNSQNVQSGRDSKDVRFGTSRDREEK